MKKANTLKIMDVAESNFHPEAIEMLEKHIAWEDKKPDLSEHIINVFEIFEENDGYLARTLCTEAFVQLQELHRLLIKHNCSYIRIIERSIFRIDVAGMGEDKWSSNGKIYYTLPQAKKALDELSQRWFGYDISRIVTIDTPRAEAVDPADKRIYQNFRK